MFKKTILFVFRVVKAQWVNLANLFLAKRIARNPNYTFTEDYCSWLAPLWEYHLAEFKGIEGINFLEIGSFEGRSAIWFLENILTHPTATLTCVDPFVRQGGEPRFDHNISISGFSQKVTKIKGRTDEITSTLEKERFDIIYIDGSHLAVHVLMDAMLSWLLLKPEGIIIFDDYAWDPHRPPHTKPKMAIDIFLEAFETQIELLHKEYQVIIRKVC